MADGSRPPAGSGLAGPRTGDAFGGLLRAAHAAGGAPGRVFEVVERDDGHVRVNDAARWLDPAVPPLEQWVHEQVRGDVVDVGCGAGRSALPLQHRGFRVLGLDPSPGALEVARERGVRDTLRGVVEDLPAASFDTALLLGNNIGLLGGRDTAAAFLSHLAAACRPGAQLLGTGVGREPGSGADACDRAYEDANLARGRLAWQVTMRSRWSDLATPWFDYAFATLADLQGLLAGSRWRLADALEAGPAYAVRMELVG